MKKMLNHIGRQQFQMIRRFLCLQQRHIRSHQHSRKMMECTTHHNPARILFRIRMLRRKSRSFRKMTFNGDYFVLLGHESAAPDFKSYDVAGFRQFCLYLAKNGKKTPKEESVITPEVLQKLQTRSSKPSLKDFGVFWTLLL